MEDLAILAVPVVVIVVVVVVAAAAAVVFVIPRYGMFVVVRLTKSVNSHCTPKVWIS